MLEQILAAYLLIGILFGLVETMAYLTVGYDMLGCFIIGFITCALWPIRLIVWIKHGGPLA